MQDILSALGIDVEDLRWQDLALCSHMETNMFYDEYEADVNVARIVDEVCLSCPVMAQCLQNGVDNNEWGVWGGIYLVSGKTDGNRNSHKTPDIWALIKERVSA